MEKDDQLLYKIAQTTAKTEERARNIERDVSDLKERYAEEAATRDKRIDALETKVDRHDVILGTTAVAVGSAVSAFFGRLFGLIKF